MIVVGLPTAGQPGSVGTPLGASQFSQRREGSRGEPGEATLQQLRREIAPSLLLVAEKPEVAPAMPVVEAQQVPDRLIRRRSTDELLVFTQE